MPSPFEAFAALRHLRLTALVQMRPEERQAALPGEIRTRLVVAGALVAAETVLRAGINEYLNIRPFRLDGLDIGQRNAGVLLAEVQLGRHGGLVVGEAHHSAAVVADRCA
jgi:hypothetical protein